MAARVKRTASAATKDLETRQKSRRTRTVRDQIDRALLDLTGLYRDVLVLQTESAVELINDEMRPTIERMAVHSDVPATMTRLDALDHARLAVAASVAPLLALEALMVTLARVELLRCGRDVRSPTAAQVRVGCRRRNSTCIRHESGGW